MCQLLYEQWISKSVCEVVTCMYLNGWSIAYKGWYVDLFVDIKAFYLYRSQSMKRKMLIVKLLRILNLKKWCFEDFCFIVFFFIELIFGLLKLDFLSNNKSNGFIFTG